jgi:predicted acetyltransferase
MVPVANVGETDDAARVELVVPSLELLPDYLDAVRRGWMGDRVLFGSPEALLALAEQDPQLVLDRLRDRSTDGVLYYGDGSVGPRVPALFRWVWDGGFAGNIDLRWQPEGDGRLPDDIPGHVGYATVQWKRGRGYATRALSLMLALAKDEGMARVELVTDVDNVASQRVVESNGGVRVEEFEQVDRLGGGHAFRWRINLT